MWSVQRVFFDLPDRLEQYRSLVEPSLENVTYVSNTDSSRTSSMLFVVPALVLADMC